ncbi:serine/threonine-protein kinase [Colletotrichum cereale]|nr:serine/threonine-protein kinase [Colletotrichum cereale]
MNVEIENGSLHELHASANTSPPIAPDLLATRFEILDKSEAFEDVDGEFKFTKTLVVYGDGKNIYHAVSKARSSELSNLSINQLTTKVLIPATAYSPLFVPTFTRAPDPLPSNTYVKKPSLLSYDRIHQGLLKNNIADNVLAEVQVCELLKQNSHPNIARYLGCQVLDGRIVGICFAKYEKTLMEAVNPHGFMKRKFSTTRQGVGNHGRQLDGIEDGIKHLHSLELVHNDLNPSNIMIDGSTWVIIDFGSCRCKGESLDGVGRTYEWFDEAVHSSLPQNDLDALREIRNWLEGAPPDAFQFKE